MGNIGIKKLNKVVVDPPVAYPVEVETRGCHYCKCDINASDLFVCIQCDTKMHRYCYYNNNRNSNYTKCPRCSIVGTIGFSYDV